MPCASSDDGAEIGRLDDPLTHTYALSPDGRRIVVGAGSVDAGTLRIFDLPPIGNAAAAKPVLANAVASVTLAEPVLSSGYLRRWPVGCGGWWVSTAQGSRLQVERQSDHLTLNDGLALLKTWKRSRSMQEQVSPRREPTMVSSASMSSRRAVSCWRAWLWGDRSSACGLWRQGRYLLVVSRRVALQQRDDIVVMRQPIAATGTDRRCMFAASNPEPDDGGMAEICQRRGPVPRGLPYPSEVASRPCALAVQLSRLRPRIWVPSSVKTHEVNMIKGPAPHA